MALRIDPYISSLKQWTPRHLGVFVLASVATYFVLGIPTAVVSNGVFGRSIETTPWSLPVLIGTAVLSGLLAATYVGVNVFDSTAKLGTIGGALSFFAIGCPVCNKLVLIALGTTGAVNYFGPIQPYLAFAGVVLLSWAFLRRLKNANACAISTQISDNTPDTQGDKTCVPQ